MREYVYMKPLTERKKKKFIQAYLDNEPLWRCAKLAGSKADSLESLRVIGYRMFKDINIDMEEIFESKGLSNAKIADVVLDGVFALDDKGRPLRAIRSKYLELFGKFRGAFIDKRELTGPGGDPLVIQLVEPQTKGSKESLNIDIDK